MPRDIFHLAYRANMSADDPETGEIMLYGEIVQDMGKFWREYFPNDKCAADFDAAIKELKKKGAKKLNLRINSPGGVVTEAVAMRAALNGAGFDKIDIRIEGLCASAATIIATLPDARVSIAPGSEYMIHNPWTIALGSANDLEKEVGHLRQIEETARVFYAQKSGQADERIKEWMDQETWFRAEDAVKYGFCDELTEEGAEHALPAAACVTQTVMTAMKGLYRAIPDDIGVTEDATVSNEAPVAGDSTEINNEEDNGTMDIKELNVDQLRAENPALLQEIEQAAVAADRQRQEDIDAITPPMAEYQAMADEAKRSGTSLTDYQRSLVAAMKAKGPAYMAARQQETAPAQAVTGGASTDTDVDEAQEIKRNAETMAAYAKAYRGGADGGMY